MKETVPKRDRSLFRFPKPLSEVSRKFDIAESESYTWITKSSARFIPPRNYFKSLKNYVCPQIVAIFFNSVCRIVTYMLPFIRVEEYITKSGTSPFAEWFDGLDAHAANKVNTYLTRIAQGNISSLKSIKGALQEVIIDWGPGYRIYVGKDGYRLIILLGGGTKKRQQDDIDCAAKLWEEYKQRKKGGDYGHYARF